MRVDLSPRRFEWNPVAKSEARNPKPEGNPKAEIRNRHRPGHYGNELSRSSVADQHPFPKGPNSRTGDWPLRISDFGLPSGFGFRVSDFSRHALAD
jgi:hypothetical protein